MQTSYSRLQDSLPFWIFLTLKFSNLWFDMTFSKLPRSTAWHVTSVSLCGLVLFLTPGIRFLYTFKFHGFILLVFSFSAYLVLVRFNF